MDIEQLIDEAVAILQRRGKISYSALKLGLSIDDDVMEVIRDELVDVMGVATDQDGKVLILAEPETDDTAQRITASDEIAERRVLTVMFCDLVGSTKLSTQFDSEDLRELFTRYQKVASDAIVESDGYVAQYLGDGILAYFGYPRIHESDAVRAVRSGLDIIARMADLNREIEAKFKTKLQVRIGIHSGEVVIGDMGAETRKETLALGEVPNVAARLQGLAEPDMIVVSESTHRLVGARVELASLGEQQLSGIDRLVEVFEVKGLSDLANLSDDGVLLVGREQELATLNHAWQSVQQGRGAAVYISGEAGIGKSTLLRGLLEREVIPREQCVIVRGQDETKLSSFRPFIDALNQLWGLRNGEDGFARLDAAMIAQPSDEKALLAELLGLSLPEGMQLPPMTPQVQRHRTMNALVKALLRVPNNEQRLLMIEDLHWFDATSIELVNLLVAATGPHATMLVLTARPEFEPGWDTRKVERIPISRLSTPEMIALIKNVAHVRELPESLVKRITSRAEGVPLFLEELTKTAFESGAVRTDEEGFVSLDGELDDNVVPVSIYGCLMTRLDQTVVSRQVAQLGAIIGNRFSFELVLAASELDDVTLQRSLLDLVKAGIVRMVGQGDEGLYEFLHAMLRDAIRQSLLRTTKRAMHGTVADTLITKFPERAQSAPETVAYHLTHAGRATEAIDYWRTAGLMALGRFANAESVDHFSRALAAAEEIADPTERHNTQLMLTVLKGAPLMTTRGWGAPEVRATYLAARDLLDKVDDKTPASLFPTMVGLTSYFIVTADWEEARRLTSQNAELAEKSGDPRLIVEALSERGVVEAYSGDPFDALKSFDRAIEHYDAENYEEHLLQYGRNGLVTNLTARALTNWSLGNIDQALDDCEHAMRVARDPYHPFSIAWSMCPLAFISLLMGESKSNIHHIEEYCSFAEEQGFPYWLGQGLVCRGWLYLLQGRYDEARVEIDRGLGIWYASGSRMLDPMMSWPRITLQIETGQLDEALESVMKARSFIAESGETWFAPETEIQFGRVIEVRNQQANDEALAAYHRAYDMAERRGAAMMQLRAALQIARVLGERGDHAGGIELLAPLEASFSEGRDTKDLVAAQNLIKSLQAK